MTNTSPAAVNDICAAINNNLGGIIAEGVDVAVFIHALAAQLEAANHRYGMLADSVANARADELNAALELPEVRELMEAMERAIEAIDAAYDGPDDSGAYTVRERAALAAIKEPKT